MSTQPIDYDALAEKARKSAAKSVDYDALAAQARTAPASHGVSGSWAPNPDASPNDGADLTTRLANVVKHPLSGLVSSGEVSKAVTGMDTNELQQMRDESPPADSTESRPSTPLELDNPINYAIGKTVDAFANPSSPEAAAARTMAAGTAKSASDVMSGFSSPLSLTTSGLGVAGKVPSAIGTVARGTNTAIGAGTAVAGIPDVIRSAVDIKKNGFTPANVEQALYSTSQVASGAGALKGAATGAKELFTSGADALLPSGDNAIISALKPKNAEIANVRRSIGTVQQDIIAAKPQSIDDFSQLTSTKRAATVGQIQQALQTAGLNTALDTQAVAQAVQPVGRITAAQNPKAQGAVTKFVKALTSSPMTVTDADAMIKEITAQQETLRNMTGSEKHAAVLQDPTLASIDQVKQELIRQIDGKLGASPQFSDLRKQYASWATLDDVATRRIDLLAKQDTVSSGMKTAAAVGSGMLGGGLGYALSGGDTGHGAVGFGGGYFLARLGEQFLVNKVNNPHFLLSRGANTLSPSAPSAPANLSGVPASILAATQQKQELSVAPNQMMQQVAQPKIGQLVQLRNGQHVRVTSIHADGSFDAEP